METILKESVFWSYDHELLNRTTWESVVSFIGPYPFHKHEGEILLSQEKITIEGDEILSIPLSFIDGLYLGFDETFPNTLVKNFGLFWQPLRITLQSGQNLYLIIGFNIWRPNNQFWFNTLKELLSE